MTHDTHTLILIAAIVAGVSTIWSLLDSNLLSVILNLAVTLLLVIALVA